MLHSGPRLLILLLRQMVIVQVLRGEIDRHSTEMKHVDHTGTYLKYFGSKQDTVYVRNRLSSIRLRWKRLLRRVDETSRRLERALRDAKRVNISLELPAIHICRNTHTLFGLLFGSNRIQIKCSTCVGWQSIHSIVLQYIYKLSLRNQHTAVSICFLHKELKRNLLYTKTSFFLVQTTFL